MSFLSFWICPIKYLNVIGCWFWGDFNIHVCCQSKLMIKNFMSLMDSLNVVKFVSCPMHNFGHTLDLVSTVQYISVKYLMLAFLIIALWCLNLLFQMTCQFFLSLYTMHVPFMLKPSELYCYSAILGDIHRNKMCTTIVLWGTTCKHIWTNMGIYT